jgi:small membrane protein
VLVIQVVLIVAVLGVGAVLVRSSAGERHQAIRRILLGLLCVLAVASILAPGVTTVVARAFGVGRGTDLLLYGLVVAFLGALVSAYRRQRSLEQRLTELTRRLALDEAEPPAVARARQDARD